MADVNEPAPSRSERAALLRWTRANYGDAFAASIVRSLLGAASETPQFDAEVLASMRREQAEAGNALRAELRRAFPSLNDREIAHLIDLARALNDYRPA